MPYDCRIYAKQARIADLADPAAAKGQRSPFGRGWLGPPIAHARGQLPQPLMIYKLSSGDTTVNVRLYHSKREVLLIESNFEITSVCI